MRLPILEIEERLRAQRFGFLLGLACGIFFALGVALGARGNHAGAAGLLAGALFAGRVGIGPGPSGPAPPAAP